MAFFFSGAASAQTLGTSARQMEPGSWKVIPYYQGMQGAALKFSVVSSGPCTPPPAPATATAFPCGSSGDVAGELDGGAGLVKFVVQPWDRMQYYVVGGIGDAKLTLANGNSLTSEGKGHLVGGGARAQLLPDTVAGPAIALDFGYGWQQYRFGEVTPSATPVIDQKLDIYQLQVALEASHKFDFQDFSLEPYGGMKWLRSHSYLKDQRNAGGGSRIGGIKDTFSPFVGLQVPVFERETLFAEAAFVDGVTYAAGLQVRFK